MNFMDLLVTGFTAMTLATLRSLLVRHYPYLPHQFDSSTTPADYYDFIVVGAGCGGSVVASRLSETSASVLLLEAGGPAPPESAVPAIATLGIFNSEIGSWSYETKPQPDAFLGFTNHTAKIKLGKVMGGTSSINGLIYNRGNKMDFDNWARMGNPGWDYNSVLPFFKKSETYNDVQVPVDGEYHGLKGPVKVQRKKIANKLTEQFLKAGRQMGYRVVDPNGAQQIGFSPSFLALGDGVRGSASESFLAPVVNRSNLLVRTEATVRRILFNKRKRAVGVQFSLNGKRRVVFARKEVILSAGVLNSPLILMLSGVGPQRHLEEMGIPVVAAVEGVGRNLQEHPGVSLSFSVKETAKPALTEIATADNFKRFVTSQTGPFAEPIIGDGYAFFNLADPNNPSWTDLLIGLTAISPAAAPTELLVQRTGLTTEIANDLYGELRNVTGFDLLVLLARPKSKGTVSLRSANPSDAPVVDLNVFSHPDDVKLLIKGIRKAYEIISMPALRDSLNARAPTKLLSPCRHLGPLTDAYWECFVRQVPLSAGYHMTSTVKMAPVSDPLGVVSSRLRVRGVTGLRVVDSSVMPQMVAGNPMAATYMIGEKGADMIKEDWGYPTEQLR